MNYQDIYNQTQSFIMGVIASGGVNTIAETIGKATITEAVKDAYKSVKEILLGKETTSSNPIKNIEKYPNDPEYQIEFNDFLKEALNDNNILKKIEELLLNIPKDKISEIQNVIKIGSSNKRIRVSQTTDGEAKSKVEMDNFNEDISIIQKSSKKN